MGLLVLLLLYTPPLCVCTKTAARSIRLHSTQAPVPDATQTVLNALSGELGRQDLHHLASPFIKLSCSR
jgi:hypothetical protein